MAYRGRGGSIKGGFKSESQHNGRVGINIHRNIYLDESEHVYKNYGDYIWGEIITLILIGIVVFIGSYFEWYFFRNCGDKKKKL